LLLLKTKIQNNVSVRSLTVNACWEFCHNNTTVTLFVKVTMLLLWAKVLNAIAILSRCMEQAL